MKLIVFGANGRQGARLVSEALARRHEVTAAVHDTARAGNVDPRALVAGSDASDPASIHAVATNHDAALLAIGGGRHAEVARAMLSGLSQAGVRRMVSPGAILAPGERTGRYRTADDQLLVGDNGRSEISMEDFAVALLDEIEQGRHVRQRFTAA